jgi:hypothetical protein
MTVPHEAALPIQSSTLFLCSLSPYCLVLDYRVFDGAPTCTYYNTILGSSAVPPYLHAARSAPYILTDRPRNPHSYPIISTKPPRFTKIFPRTFPTGSKTGNQASEIIVTQTNTRSSKLKEYNIALLGDKSVEKTSLLRQVCYSLPFVNGAKCWMDWLSQLRQDRCCLTYFSFLRDPRLLPRWQEYIYCGGIEWMCCRSARLLGQ